MSRPPITLSGVTVAYGRHPAVSAVSGTFQSGGLTAIVGPNGAGKSTLLKALMGELPLAAGFIDRGGLSTRDFGYLPQAADVDRSFPLSVADTVALGAWSQAGLFGSVSAASAVQARDALQRVGLAGFERRHVGSLSAGQFQRVLFARLLVQDTKVILLDEPFTAIDAGTTRDLLGVVQVWHAEGRTVMAALHDFEQVKAYFPETLLLARTPVFWGATKFAMTAENLARALSVSATWERPAHQERSIQERSAQHRSGRAA